jgi:hypothetical protein
MMHVEIQEGKVRMNRKKWHQQRGATTACTLRCLEEPGCAQKDRRPEEREPRTCGGDSWFAGLRTTRARDDEFGIKFVGPVKTNTKGFPRDAIRHTLHGTPRGTHIVFEERDEHDEKTGMHAIGWNDHWCKWFITNYGSVAAGKPANKKGSGQKTVAITSCPHPALRTWSTTMNSQATSTGTAAIDNRC